MAEPIKLDKTNDGVDAENDVVVLRKPKTKKKPDEHVHVERPGAQVEILTPTYGIVVISANLRDCCRNAASFARFYEDKEKLKITNSRRSVT